ncbi:hypothetical protein K439DRAFT_1618253 [Ramaria rubella]|nr:hypothetical protein K439DRAFT_1618253 [Ramaria rubella]
MVKGKLTRCALQSAPTAEMSRAERASTCASKKVAPNTASTADQATANSTSGTLPVRKKGSDKIGKPSVDTEIISVHSSSPLVNSFFFWAGMLTSRHHDKRACDKQQLSSAVGILYGFFWVSLMFFTRVRRTKREHTLSPVVKQEDGIEEDHPSPSKKSRKHLQGVIPTSNEEPQGNIMATNEGGWSDDLSSCGFIVDDDAFLEIMTDSGNKYVSSGGTLQSSHQNCLTNGAEVLQEPHTTTSTTSSMLGTERGGVDREKVLKTVGLLRGPQNIDLKPVTKPSSESFNQEAEVLQSPIRLSHPSQTHPLQTPKSGEHRPSGSGASQATSSWDDNDNSYYRCMKEYQANKPAKCAVLDDISDLSEEHRELLLDAPCWSLWFQEFLSKPYYGTNYANFARFPESKHVWRSVQDPSAFGKSGSYVMDWQFNKGATVNVLLGGVGSCKLVDHILLNGKLHRQICIYPLDGEWQRFVTMIGAVYMTRSLEFNTYKGAIVIGTRGVNANKNQTNLAVSSKGKFASSAWSPSKRKAAVGQDKDKKKWANTMWGNAEVLIYNGRGLNILWDDVGSMARVSEDLDLDTVVLIAHTTSIYGENNVSLNVQFVVQVA